MSICISIPYYREAQYVKNFRFFHFLYMLINTLTYIHLHIYNMYNSNAFNTHV